MGRRCGDRMASDAQKVTFRAAQWSVAAARELSKIADATLADITTFAREVSAGRWQLWEIMADDQRVGFIVWSVENDSKGFSLIVNAAHASPVPGACVATEILSAFEAMGRKTGAHSIRCWTIREGLRRKLEKSGAKRRYVMEIDL